MANQPDFIDSIVVSPDSARRAALSILERELAATVGRLSTQSPRLLRHRTEHELATTIRDFADQATTLSRPDKSRLADADSALAEVGSAVQVLLDSVSGAPTQLLAAVNTVATLARRLAPSGSGPGTARFSVGPHPDGLEVSTKGALAARPAGTPKHILDEYYLEAVMAMCASGVWERLPWEDDLALQLAFQLLDRGARVPRIFEPVRRFTDRQIQTYLSFADPGDGHLAVTVKNPTLLHGTIVHVEHIDRDGVVDRNKVEAYRLPSIRHVLRVRLCVGGQTPCTVYVGRPVFEARVFELDLLKAAHTVAGVCTAMFTAGVADCKIAMDGMTARQTVDFMRTVAGNAVREASTQMLSAAFNVNAPLRDDWSSKDTREITDARFVSRLAVKLVVAGRFDKVAWDGANSQGRSESIVKQLGHRHLCEIIHEAHSHGLETYMSAGMPWDEIVDAVFLGVGGAGIGTDLHEPARENGVIGAILPHRVEDTLKLSSRARKTPIGVAAATLAKLDWLYAQKSLQAGHDEIRDKLFIALADLHTERESRPELADPKVVARPDRIALWNQLPSYAGLLDRLQHLQRTAGDIWSLSVAAPQPFVRPVRAAAPASGARHPQLARAAALLDAASIPGSPAHHALGERGRRSLADALARGDTEALQSWFVAARFAEPEHAT